MAAVVLQGVRKRFGPVEAVRGVDLAVAPGEFVVFVGPSGCGKSTLLRLIAGLEDVTAGTIAIDGRRVDHLPPAERGIAMVFQSYALYPTMNVYDNMAFGLQAAKMPRAEIDARVREAARSLQIESLLARKPRELSGGQRQRVAIGRAIVRNPKVFLFDEPLSNLDAALRVQTRIGIARLHAETGTTMIYVTHDQVEAMTLADRIVVLNAGRVEQVGAPLDLYHRPANLFVAGFLGSPQMNFLESRVEAVEASGLRCGLPGGGVVLAEVAPDGVRPGDEITLGIRPEHLIPDAGGGTAVRGRIELVERLGESHLLHLRVAADLMLTVRAAGDPHHRTGDHLAVAVPGRSCHVFDRTGAALLRRMPA